MSKSTQLDQTIKKYLINNIDLSGYELNPETLEEKIKALKGIFEAEYICDYHLKRFGYVGSISEWLQGLPSSLTVDYMYHDILQLAVKWGSLPENHTDKQAQKIIDNYWNLIAVKLNQLFDGYRVPRH